MKISGAIASLAIGLVIMLGLTHFMHWTDSHLPVVTVLSRPADMSSEGVIKAVEAALIETDLPLAHGGYKVTMDSYLHHDEDIQCVSLVLIRSGFHKDTSVITVMAQVPLRSDSQAILEAAKAELVKMLRQHAQEIRDWH